MLTLSNLNDTVYLLTGMRDVVRPASYAGYMDSNISVDPLQSYYGGNICRLVDVKKAYDPDNFFTNPQAIPPTYVSC